MTNRLKTLAVRLLKLFQSKDDSAGAPAAEPGAGGKPPPGALKSEKAFEARLVEFLAEKKVVSAGKVQIIGFEQLREHFGERWEKITGKVHGIVRSIIERHLTPADLYTGKEGIGYVLVFANLAPEEAAIKAALIAEEIHHHLIGDDVEMAATIKVKTAVVGVDNSVTVEDVGLLDSVSRLLEDAMSGSAGAAKPPPARAAAPIPGDGGDPLRDVFCLYRLIWDVRRKVLSTYLCTAARKIPGGGMVWGSDVAVAEEASTRIAELDLFVLRRVRHDLESLQRNKRRVLMACPVHVATLAGSRSHLAFRETCQSLPEALRRDLVFELMGLTGDTPRSRVLELVSGLKALSRSVTARVPANHRNFDILRGAGVNAVGFDLGGSGVAEGQVMRRMDQFAGLADKAGLRTCVYGLDTLSLAAAAISSGFDYIEGKAVHSEVDAPENIYRFQSADLFAHLMGQAGA